jgi:hypothetical protein
MAFGFLIVLAARFAKQIVRQERKRPAVQLPDELKVQ